MQNAEDTTTKIQLDRNVLNISQDPLHHGFWQLSLDRGSLPKEFQGRYTKRTEALKAAQVYIDNRKPLKD